MVVYGNASNRNERWDDTSPKGVKSVFALSNDCPDNTTTNTVGMAVEKIAGVRCYGAQERAGLWRIQTFSIAERIKLLAGCFVMGGKKITIHDRNPLLRGDVEDEAPSTKLTISDLPFSYSNEAIDKGLTEMGFILRTRIKNEFGKDQNGHVGRYRCGQRSVWINLPETPPNKKVRFGDFQASIFYWEMKNVEMQCRRCFEFGHKAVECKNEEVCMKCRLPGHRRGATICTGSNQVGKGAQNKPVTQIREDYRCSITFCGKTDHEVGDEKCKFWGQTGAPHCHVGKPCTLCGSPTHHEDDLSCFVNFPPLVRCKDCDSTEHKEGDASCREKEVIRCRTCDMPGHLEGDRECHCYEQTDACKDCDSIEHLEGDKECIFYLAPTLPNEVIQPIEKQPTNGSNNGEQDPQVESNQNEKTNNQPKGEVGDIASNSAKVNIEGVEPASSNIINIPSVEENTTGESQKEKEVKGIWGLFSNVNQNAPTDSSAQEEVQGQTKRETPASSPDGLAKGSHAKIQRVNTEL